MSSWLLVFSALALVNPPRTLSAVPAGPDRVPVAALAAALTWAALVPFAVFAEPLLDLVPVSAATARMAEGVLLVVTGLLLLAWPSPGPEPGLPGRRAALVPVAFPVLLTPGLGLLALVGAEDRGSALTLAVLALALVTVPVVARLVPAPVAPARERVRRGLARAFAAALLPLGGALVVNGLFDI
jgi:small neutral amino acid transporter SnatA (MarC family)